MTDRARDVVDGLQWLISYYPKWHSEADPCAVMHSAIGVIESLAAELEQVKRERDAAVEDLRKVCKAKDVCFCCKSYDATLAEYVSNDCMDCIKHCNWRWSGEKEG